MLSENIQLSQPVNGWDGEASPTGFIDMFDLLTNPDMGIDIDIGNVPDKILATSDHTTASGHLQQPSFSLPASLSYKDPSSLLQRREFSQVDLQLTSDLALHILSSYLYTMADQGSPPPFIHPSYQYLKEIDTDRPSPLSAAMNLAKMLFIGHGTNKTLIWKLIQTEQERLLYDYSKFNRWQALEALQSIILYILLRINEGRRDYTNFDTKLFISLNAICRHISTNFGKLVSSDELNGEMIPWKDWVFYESRRRSATVIYIIDSILYARISEPGPGMPEYNHAPAPSPLTLWNAENESDWTAGYANYLHANTADGMLKNADLVALREAATGNQNERWYAYADSFGLLVTLTANLII
ncbi:uncharacterized protein E0L32_012298 [Thyridium curvatum]|uniref:Uncharacterized protein n=1 Tax=Thyridium curvatum TaxID=1093900 RepID=A0A507BJ23_9PEZI|nr:uncharacterized protein E0L32_012298 [Thyridium curvatum]TPX17041.1 hypothetical protein E0L32_012298 [Thyridium curvatum]